MSRPSDLPLGRELTGTVVEYDRHVGLGTIVDADEQRYLFHCIEIADGTRDIEVGTAVTFRELRKFGKVEAADIRS